MSLLDYCVSLLNNMSLHRRMTIEGEPRSTWLWKMPFAHLVRRLFLYSWDATPPWWTR